MSSLVFVLDDDIATLTIIEEILSSSDFKVKKFLDSNSLFEALKISKPSLVILDIMMPNVDGIHVCEKLKSFPNVASTPIVMLSAKVSDNSKKLAFSVGASGFITKPFTARELVSAVRTYIELYDI